MTVPRPRSVGWLRNDVPAGLCPSDHGTWSLVSRERVSSLTPFYSRLGTSPLLLGPPTLSWHSVLCQCVLSPPQAEVSHTDAAAPGPVPQLRPDGHGKGSESPARHDITDPDSSGATLTVTSVAPMTPAHPAAGGRSGNRSPPKGSAACTRSRSAPWWPGRPQGGARPPSFTGSQAG